MPTEQSRRWFLRGSAAAGAVALAGCTGSDDTDDDDESPPEDEDESAPDDEDESAPDDEDESAPDDDEDLPDTYEIWAADQGLDTIHVYEGVDGEDEFEEIEQIDVGMLSGRPHMVHYDSEFEYAAVANARGPVIIDTESKEVVAEIETGGGSHFAGFTPDDDAIIVDVIGDNKIVKIDADLEEEEFEIVDEIVPSEEIEAIEDTQNPVCHSYTHDGRSVHTLGPGYGDGGVVLVDHDNFEIDHAFAREETQANCGTMPHYDEEKFYLTAGLPSDPEAGEDGLGEYYVLDTENDEVIEQEDSRGIDAHGFWFSTDGEELWILNRETNDGAVIDPETDEVIEEIDAFGPAQGEASNERDAPDIIWGSPDGEWMFATLRGPDPVTADPHAATGVTPGFSVIDTETKEIETVIEPVDVDDFSQEEIDDPDTPIPDFHGIGVRPVGDFDVEVGSPPY